MTRKPTLDMDRYATRASEAARNLRSGSEGFSSFGRFGSPRTNKRSDQQEPPG